MLKNVVVTLKCHECGCSEIYEKALKNWYISPNFNGYCPRCCKDIKERKEYKHGRKSN